MESDVSSECNGVLDIDDLKVCDNKSDVVSCSDCRLGNICLPLVLEADEVSRLEEIVRRGRPLRKAEHLYHESDEFVSVYAVRSGAVKTYKVTADGGEQVTGFYFPGEIFGMDGIGKNSYTCSAKALETSAVCEIPFHRLEDLASQLPSMQRHFFQLMSQEITNDQQLITLLSKNTAEERIASLLMSISFRNAQRKLSKTHFRLPMSRTDIGNFLGLTVETVSRVVSRFNKQGFITVENKEITLLDLPALKKLASFKGDF
jgi:CRP/FNR family transcriptional regulator